MSCLAILAAYFSASSLRSSDLLFFFYFFFFNDPATTEIYTLSLHDALPICALACTRSCLYVHICMHVRVRDEKDKGREGRKRRHREGGRETDRKSTRLNSSHGYISYAVFCLKKKKQQIHTTSNQQQQNMSTLGTPTLMP